MGFRTSTIVKKYGRQYRGFSKGFEPSLLDEFPNAKCAYSLRRLSKDYSGFAIKVIRDSDDAQLEIGFLENGLLDVAKLVEFTGSDTANVIIFYDQSGNGIDLHLLVTVESTPKIIVDGTLQIDIHGLPVLFFDGFDDILVSTNTLASPVSQLFVFGVWRKINLSDTPVNFNLNAPENGSIVGERVSVHAPHSNGIIFWDAGSIVSDRVQTEPDFDDTLTHLYTFTKIAGVNNQKIRRDGIQLAEKTQETSSTILNKVTLGEFGTSVGLFANMDFQELIFYDTDELDNISEIETNLNKHYSIF